MSVREQIFGVLQRVGRAFMLPIAILPVAGLLLGIGGSFTNETMLKSRGLWEIMGEGTIPYAILSVMSACGGIVFGNLPLIFAIGVAIGMAKAEKEVAALSGAVAFFVMHAAIGSMLTISGAAAEMLPGTVAQVVGIESLQMGVFGGIIVGLGVAALHNRFYKIDLPQMLAFFGGTRFVPIISALVFAVVGMLMYFVWPPVQNGIYAVGDLVRSSGYAGTMLYGFMERILIPFGLHHVFYMPFWQTGVGGSATIDGILVQGAQNIFFAELGSPTVTEFSVEATRFMSGKFPFMIFGLPAAAYAMYRCARPEKRKLAGSLLFSAALTSVVTGITEPIEFTFLFVSLPLYLVHCVLSGASYMIMHMMSVGVGMTFSGGAIDLLLFGVLQGNDKSHWVNVIIAGIGYAVVYYFLFSTIIKKFNLKTPGREDDTEETKLYTRADVNAAKEESKKAGGSAAANPVSVMILEGLGGKANITDLDNCATRLRITVVDPTVVNDAVLKRSGAAGVIKKGNGVQVIYGPQVSVIKSDLAEYMETL
jgi:PTS system D-glucosamine-specific IIC component